jgi:hypothetical protein
VAADCIDSAEAANEIAVALGDAAASVASDDRPPANALAGRLREQMAQSLREQFGDSGEAPDLLRSVGMGIAKLLEARRERRVKAAADAKVAKLNASVRQRSRAVAVETPADLAARFTKEQAQQMFRGTPDEEGLRNALIAERDAIERGAP